MLKKVLLKIYKRRFRKRGLSDYFCPKLAEVFLADYMKAKGSGFKDVYRAHKYGFVYETYLMNQITEDNYEDYLCDLDYYSMHPINKEYTTWIDDKLTLKYMLGEHSNLMPAYYYHIVDKNTCLPLMDLPKELRKERIVADDVIELLEDKKALLLKKRIGTMSKGLHIAKYMDDDFYWNDEKCGKDDIREKIESLQDYVVQEFIRFASEFPKCFNSMRIVVINEDGRSPKIIGAFIYLHEEINNTDVSTSVVFGNIDIETGKYNDFTRVIIPSAPGFYTSKTIYNIDVKKNDIHIEGEVPMWGSVIDSIDKICERLPQLSYMGMDFVVDESGAKLLEINSHQGLIWQPTNPFMVKGTASEEFFSKRLKRK